ncbi:methyltransferase domain-containing protein [Isoptericola sp. NEAU-Y5]|uniref:Methyltransferase domain-containing protein n=1 Tax=Isoptericola luteus TaxID=2879484 RepID=A0ABS7ZDI8_9MICO|nr:methyltransferase domain-containing protein [Isoptericola sp. NEAU-Y5]MCA5893100.1 methyltransferase domain-containing protein [Isoptericola sp. NEAU-Y5]
MSDWSPTAYLRYTDERSRPFAELLARVTGAGTAAPATVLDLGCGPGHLTALVRDRWPGAVVVGLDASPAMIEQARAGDPDGSYVLGDVRDVAAGALVAGLPERPDLVISNATLQWVPGHRDLLARLAARAAQTFAFSVPGNHDAPSHRTLREVAGRAPYADAVGPVERRAVGDPAEYLELLAGPGWSVDAWETTYTHVLDGEDPVLRWISATGAQPVLHALDAHDATHGTGLRRRFDADLGAALREAYPRRPFGTPLEFRRVFAVATRSGTGADDGPAGPGRDGRTVVA